MKKTALTILTGAALLGGEYQIARGQSAITLNFSGQVNPYTTAQQASMQRGADYWNEVITNRVGGPITITVNQHDATGNFPGHTNLPAGWAHANQSARYECFSEGGWSDTRNTQIKTAWSSYESVMIHELAHSLGLTNNGQMDIEVVGGITTGRIRFTSLTGGWTSNLRLPNGGTPVANTWYTLNAATPWQFVGSNASEVWGDFWFTGTRLGVPVESLNNVDPPTTGSTLVHPLTPYGNMNALYDDMTRPFFSEAELAIMQDIGGLTIDRANFFGRSIYQTHVGATITNTMGFDKTSTFGIGLHLVAGDNTVIQDADLTSNGYAGAGIRVEDDNNTVTVATGRRVQANGEQGVGVLVTHGEGTTLINRGTIEAKGLNGRGVWFNADADTFDNTGTINVGAANDAIFISAGAKVEVINLMGNGPITGNITNMGQDSTLTFGKTADATTGVATPVGNGGYGFTYSGQISDNKFDLETWGGDTTLTAATLQFNDGKISTETGAVASTLKLPNTTEFTSLAIGSATNAFGTLDGDISGKVSVLTNMNNYGTAKNLLGLSIGADLSNHGSGKVVDSMTVRVTGKLDNAGLVDTVTFVDVTGNIDNTGTVKNVTTLKTAADLNNLAAGKVVDSATVRVAGKLDNAGLVDTVTLVDVTGNIDNTGTVQNVSTLKTAADLNNLAAGKVVDSATVRVAGKLVNAGLVDTAHLVDVTGNIDNAGTVQNVSTLKTAANLINSATGRVVDNKAISTGRDMVNAGLVDRFSTANIGRNVSNTNTGYVNVGNQSTMTVTDNGRNSGRMTLNGEAAFGNSFTNNATGLVDGSGKVTTFNGFINDGTISPGNSIDTLTVAGQFTNNATGTFNIEVDPSHYPGKPIAGFHNDLVNVVDNPATPALDGKATVNGGIVNVAAPSNDKSKTATPARYVGNTKYTFLDTPASGDLAVNAPIVANDPPNLLLFDFLADHDTKSYWLDVQREYYYGPFGDTINQRNLGYYIDDIGLDPDPMGDFFDVLVKLDKLNVGIAHRAGISRAAKFAEDQMSGAVYGSIATSSIMNTTIVNNTLNDVLRRDAFGQGQGQGSSACDPCGSCEPCSSNGSKSSYKRNAWGLAYGMGGHTQFDGNAYGYDQTFGGTILGFDRQFKRKTRVGTYVSYGEGRISSALFDRSKSKELLVGLYLRKNLQTGYALVSGGLGYNQYDTERTISFMERKTTNEHNAFVGTVYGEYGLEFKGQHNKLQPFIGLQYVGNQQEGFTERGADSLNLVADETTGNSFRSLLGARLSSDLARSRRGAFSLFGQAIWMHEFLDQSYTGFTARFSNPGMSNFSSNSSFKVRGNDPGRDWAILGAGLSFDRNHWRLFGGYDLYANDRQVLHTGNAGLVYGW